MRIEFVIAAILVVATAGYAFFMLLLIRRSPCFTYKQKLMQALIVATIPIFGAWFVHALYRSDEELPIQEDKNHIPDGG